MISPHTIHEAAMLARLLTLVCALAWAALAMGPHVVRVGRRCGRRAEQAAENAATDVASYFRMGVTR